MHHPCLDRSLPANIYHPCLDRSLLVNIYHPCCDRPLPIHYLSSILGWLTRLSMCFHHGLFGVHEDVAIVNPYTDVACILCPCQMFRKQLVQMFRSMDKDVVFMETSMRLRHFPHMALECIPLDRELAETAPIYFKVMVVPISSLTSREMCLSCVLCMTFTLSLPHFNPFSASF